MTEIISQDAGVELRIRDGELVAYFCDAQVAQWETEYGQFRDENRSDIEEWLHGEIEAEARSLARSIVRDLFDRVLPASRTEGGDTQ